MNDLEMSSIGIVSQRMSYITIAGPDDYQDLLLDKSKSREKKSSYDGKLLTDSLHEDQDEILKNHSVEIEHFEISDDCLDSLENIKDDSIESETEEEDLSDNIFGKKDKKPYLTVFLF